MRGATRIILPPIIPQKFQPTRPLRGATAFLSCGYTTVLFQPTRPLRGATKMTLESKAMELFQPTRPLRGATLPNHVLQAPFSYFNPRAPCGARRRWRRISCRSLRISTHAPLAGRDLFATDIVPCNPISTHAPLAGRDRHRQTRGSFRRISTHAPLAGRDSTAGYRCRPSLFQPTRPLRGATTGRHYFSRCG